MLPIGPLMIEHRLIEKMIRLMGQEAVRVKDNIRVSRDFAFVNEKFIDAAMDFMRTYADQVHHGKEEDILFTVLQEKPLSPDHRRIMQELQEDHTWGRHTTAGLLAAKERYLAGQTAALDEVLDNLTSLVDFYPRHIEKEDKHFFIPIMAYFSQEEKELLLARMAAFDRGFDQAKYHQLVADWETSGCKCHL
jgi:hemerythrin-like domain-containing protein